MGKYRVQGTSRKTLYRQMTAHKKRAEAKLPRALKYSGHKP